MLRKGGTEQEHSTHGSIRIASEINDNYDS